MKDGIADGSGESDGQRTVTPHQPNANASPLSQDNVFDALASRRSRYVLTFLREADEPVDMEDLVETVATWETGKPIDLVSKEHCERVFTSLRHSQLPKLSMMGMVEYDEDDDVVVRGPHAEQVDAYLDIATSRDDNVEL
ncbi:hypothetical protein NGM10_07675 [Halorussus salilacus]|uniref:DUF7344 domain-containing protein n=1 Tax=Halorussus salilacus TaxID=2953750 RepID=UPI00209EBAA2|nr:hypothetical protein [Halorussus salilacus]USZ69599.1 hypothetical protein NGM10_07675 [Halorussus salilacus]